MSANQTNQTTLFDFVQDVNEATTSFMDKLSSVKTSPKNIFGEDFTSQIELLLLEYNDMKKYHEAVAALNVEQIKKAKEYKEFQYADRWGSASFINNSFGLYEYRGYSAESNYKLESKLETIRGQLCGLLTQKVKQKWTIELEFWFKDFDITIDQIMQQLAEATNNGSFEETKKDQTIENLKKEVVDTVGIFEFRKSKMSISSFAYARKCNIFKKYEADISYSKREAFIASLSLLAKEQKLEDEMLKYPELYAPHTIITDINKYLDLRNEDRGAFDEKVFLKNNFIEKAKLLKNGKLEITFASESIANAYLLNFVRLAGGAK